MNRSESKYFNTAVKMDLALMEILSKKEFEYITVSEICKKAGVNRSTFYLHYENTSELLNETARYLINDFISYFNFDKNFMEKGFFETEEKELIFISEKYLEPYLSYIKDNRKVFSTALIRKSSLGFESTYQKMFDYIFSPIMEKFGYPESEKKYIIKFYLNGITAVINEWLLENCEKTTEEIIAIIKHCIFGLEK